MSGGHLRDQDITRSCYFESLKLKKMRVVGVNTVGVKFEAKQREITLEDQGLTDALHESTKSIT